MQDEKEILKKQIETIKNMRKRAEEIKALKETLNNEKNILGEITGSLGYRLKNMFKKKY